MSPAKVGTPIANVTGGRRQYATFRVCDLLFGIEVREVNEVLLGQTMTPVPLAPAVVQGLINLRGQIVTAIDMRRRLKLPSREPAEVPMNVVVRAGDSAVSLLVDEIGDVLEAGNDTLEAVPQNVQAELRELAESVHKLDGRLLLILNTEKTVQVQA